MIILYFRVIILSPLLRLHLEIQEEGGVSLRGIKVFILSSSFFSGSRVLNMSPATPLLKLLRYSKKRKKKINKKRSTRTDFNMYGRGSGGLRKINTLPPLLLHFSVRGRRGAA
jgi:hypothetical protein